MNENRASHADTGAYGNGLSRGDFLKMSGAGLAGAALLAAPGTAEAQSSSEYIDFREHGPSHFVDGAKAGLAVENGVLKLSNPARQGDDFVGVLTSKPVATSISYNTLIPSWDARTPPGTSVTMLVRVRYGDRWSDWMSLGSYSASERGGSTSPTHPGWKVDVDTISSRNGELADAYQYRLRLYSEVRDRGPFVRRVALVSSKTGRHGDSINVGNLERTWGKSLNLPRRSQYDYEAGAAWCSPTALSMVTTYWGIRYNDNTWKKTPPTVARGVYDAGAEIWGNWPFNTAYSSHLNLKSSVSRFNSLQQVERWIDVGIPVIASVAWDNSYGDRRLNNASIPRATYGHLLVIVGFTRAGNVIVNDSATSPSSQARRVYDRAQFARAWLNTERWRGGRSDGVVYLVHPRGVSIPGPYASKGSW